MNSHTKKILLSTFILILVIVLIVFIYNKYVIYQQAKAFGLDKYSQAELKEQLIELKDSQREIGITFETNTDEGEIFRLITDLNLVEHVTEVQYTSRNEARDQFLADTNFTREELTITEASSLTNFEPKINIIVDDSEYNDEIIKYITETDINKDIIYIIDGKEKVWKLVELLEKQIR